MRCTMLLLCLDSDTRECRGRVTVREFDSGQQPQRRARVAGFLNVDTLGRTLWYSVRSAGGGVLCVCKRKHGVMTFTRVEL